MKGKFNIYILLEFVIGAYLMLLFKSYIFYLFCVAGFSSLYIHFMTTLKTHFKILIRLSMFLIFCGAIIWAINNRSFLGEILFSEMFNLLEKAENIFQNRFKVNLYVFKLLLYYNFEYYDQVIILLNQISIGANLGELNKSNILSIFKIMVNSFSSFVFEKKFPKKNKHSAINFSLNPILLI